VQKHAPPRLGANNTYRRTLGHISAHMKKLFNILIILSVSSSIAFCQTLTWRDTYDCDYLSINIAHDQPIDCANFFELADSCRIKELITYNWTAFPSVENLDSVLTVIHYPASATRFRISGRVIIRFLIDKQGNVYCHKILTDLGDKFILEAEKAIVLLRFSEASIDNDIYRPVRARIYSFIWDSTKKPNRKQKNRYVP